MKLAHISDYVHSMYVVAVLYIFIFFSIYYKCYQLTKSVSLVSYTHLTVNMSETPHNQKTIAMYYDSATKQSKRLLSPDTEPTGLSPMEKKTCESVKGVNVSPVLLPPKKSFLLDERDIEQTHIEDKLIHLKPEDKLDLYFTECPSNKI